MKQTRQQLEESARYDHEQAFILAMAYQAQAQGDIIWSRWTPVEDQSKTAYKVGVVGLDRADGGFLTLAFRAPDQADYYTAHYYERFTRDTSRDACHGSMDAHAIQAGLMDAMNKYRSIEVAA